MNPAHLHLLINHIPVLSAALAVLVLAAAVVRANTTLTRCALTLLVISALAAIPTYLSGEPAEDVAEEAAGDIEEWVEPHEDAALVSLGVIEVLGVLSLAVLWIGRGGSIPRGAVIITLLAAAIAAGSLAWTSHLGAQIRHSEIRGGQPANQR